MINKIFSCDVTSINFTKGQPFICYKSNTGAVKQIATDVQKRRYYYHIYSACMYVHLETRTGFADFNHREIAFSYFRLNSLFLWLLLRSVVPRTYLIPILATYPSCCVSGYHVPGLWRSPDYCADRGDVCTLPAITATTRHRHSRFHLSLFLHGTVPTAGRDDHVEIVSTNVLSR